jgi:hypothetical protein
VWHPSVQRALVLAGDPLAQRDLLAAAAPTRLVADVSVEVGDQVANALHR